MDATARVVVVDDHEVVRTGLRLALDGDPQIQLVGEATTARQARDRIVATDPDVAIVDLTLPDGDGIALIRDLRARCPSVRCVVFSAVTEPERILAAARAGAAAYLDKTTAHEQLLRAIHLVADGATLLCPSLLADVRRLRSDDYSCDPLLASLTAQEQRIVGMITDGCTNRDIADRLGIRESTVRNYVSSILAKTRMDNRTQLAVFITQRPHPTLSGERGHGGMTVFHLAMAELAGV